MGANRSRCGCRPLIGGILRCTTVEIPYAGSVRSTIKNDFGGVTTAISDPKTKRDTASAFAPQIASHCLGFLSSRTYSYIRGGRSRMRKVVWNHKSWAQLSPTRVASFTHHYDMYEFNTNYETVVCPHTPTFSFSVSPCTYYLNHF